MTPRYTSPLGSHRTARSSSQHPQQAPDPIEHGTTTNAHVPLDDGPHEGLAVALAAAVGRDEGTILLDAEGDRRRFEQAS